MRTRSMWYWGFTVALGAGLTQKGVWAGWPTCHAEHPVYPCAQGNCCRTGSPRETLTTELIESGAEGGFQWIYTRQSFSCFLENSGHKGECADATCILCPKPSPGCTEWDCRFWRLDNSKKVHKLEKRVMGQTPGDWQVDYSHTWHVLDYNRCQCGKHGCS